MCALFNRVNCDKKHTPFPIEEKQNRKSKDVKKYNKKTQTHTSVVHIFERAK